MDVTEIINRMDFKHDALVELIKVMDKYNLSFVSETEHTEQGEISRLRVMADYFEDGDPIVLREVAKIGRAANMEIEDVAGKSE